MASVDPSSDDLIVVENKFGDVPEQPAARKRGREPQNKNKALMRGASLNKQESSLKGALASGDTNADAAEAASAPKKKRRTMDMQGADGSMQAVESEQNANEASAISNTTMSQSFPGLRVKSITLSGQRSPLCGENTKGTKILASPGAPGSPRGNKTNQGHVSRLFPNTEQPVKENPEGGSTLNTVPGSDAECLRSTADCLSTFPEIDVCTINISSTKDKKQEAEAWQLTGLGTGALSRFKRLLSVGSEASSIPTLQMPMLKATSASDDAIKQLRTAAPLQTPQECSFIQHRLNALGADVMKLYQIREVVRPEELPSFVTSVRDIGYQLKTFIALMNDFFAEIDGLYLREPRSIDPVYVYHCRGHEVRLEHLYQCFIERLSRLCSEKLNNTPEASPAPKPQQPFGALLRFMDSYDTLIGVYKDCKRLHDTASGFKSNIPQTCCGISNLSTKTEALLNELVQVVNHAIGIIWKYGPTIYDCYFARGVRDRVEESHAKGLVEILAGLSERLSSLSPGNLREAAKSLHARAQEIGEQLRAELANIDKAGAKTAKIPELSDAKAASGSTNVDGREACRVVFKHESEGGKEWTINLDDGLDGIFDDLFGEDQQRKLYCEGIKVSRNLTARENGLFAGVNYVTLHSSDNLPLKATVGIIVQLGPEASDIVSIAPYKVATVRDIIDRVKQKTGSSDEYNIAFNGLYLEPEQGLAGLVGEGDVLDAIPASKCKF